MKQRLTWFVVGVFCWSNLTLARNAASEKPLDQPTATIAGQGNKSFVSLQEALNAAAPGAVINLSVGRFDERVTIAKPVILVGAGAEKTILGPTKKEQTERWDRVVLLSDGVDDIMRAAEQRNPRQSFSEAETKEFTEIHAEIQRLVDLCLKPVVMIEGTGKIVLRSLRVTMPLTPREGNGRQVTAAVKVKDAHAEILNSMVVDCLSNGIQADGDSHLVIVDSLVAACWGTGVSSSSAEAKVQIVDSDIRNNYHYNIGLRSDSCVIEGCRISGTAFSGISCGGVSPRIERNVIFNNSRGIYSAGSKGVVTHNLIYRNHQGASCWSSDQPLYEGNVFLENDLGLISVKGPGEPKFRKNLFVGSPYGVSYSPMGITRGEKPPATEFHLENNVFWQVDKPVVLRKSRSDHSQDKQLSIVGKEGNRVADPHTAIDNEQLLVIENGDMVRELKISKLLGLSLRSSWPITPEELAMIPDDGTVDSSKWKKRPKL